MDGLSIDTKMIKITIIIPINRRALITHNDELEWIVSFNANNDDNEYALLKLSLRYLH